MNKSRFLLFFICLSFLWIYNQFPTESGQAAYIDIEKELSNSVTALAENEETETSTLTKTFTTTATSTFTTSPTLISAPAETEIPTDTYAPSENLPATWTPRPTVAPTEMETTNFTIIVNYHPTTVTPLPTSTSNGRNTPEATLPIFETNTPLPINTYTSTPSTTPINNEADSISKNSLQALEESNNLYPASGAKVIIHSSIPQIKYTNYLGHASFLKVPKTEEIFISVDFKNTTTTKAINTTEKTSTIFSLEVPVVSSYQGSKASLPSTGLRLKTALPILSSILFLIWQKFRFYKRKRS